MKIDSFLIAIFLLGKLAWLANEILKVRSSVVYLVFVRKTHYLYLSPLLTFSAAIYIWILILF